MLSASFVLVSSRGSSRPATIGLGRTVSALLSLAVLGACAGRTPSPVRPTVPAPVATVSVEDAAYLRARQLLLPVANVRTRTLRSSFDDPRDGGERMHLALDILAPRGTPVLAADDGRVWTVRQNTLGGLTVYTVDPAERFVFYYAHLDRYQPGLVDGIPILKGDTLGYVGTTGNAPPDVPHLHFQVARIGPDHKWWTGVPVDPTPYLRDVEVALAGRDGLARAARAESAHAIADDAPHALVVPAIGTRRMPTVPADTAAPDTTGRRRETRGPR